MNDNLARTIDDQVGYIDLWDEDVELLSEEDWPTLSEPVHFDPTAGKGQLELEDCIMLLPDPPPNPCAFVLDPLPLDKHREALQSEVSDSVQASIVTRLPGCEVAQSFEAAVVILKVRHDLVSCESRGCDPSRETLDLLVANEPPRSCPVLHREWRQALTALQD